MEAPGGPIRDADDKPMEPGPTICIKAVGVDSRVGFNQTAFWDFLFLEVPEGTAGTVIKVPHPKAKGTLVFQPSWGRLWLVANLLWFKCLA